MKQFRSARSTLATKVRDALFTYFGEVNLPRINTSAPPIDISNWKKSNEVRKCYDKLFDNKNKALAKVLEKVFGKNLPKAAHSAFAIAVCTSILNPESDRIQLSEESMKVIYNNHLVSIIIQIICYYLFINILSIY
jgi:hypothetical protein